jgi:hypothetical protein
MKGQIATGRLQLPRGLPHHSGQTSGNGIFVVSLHNSLV